MVSTNWGYNYHWSNHLWSNRTSGPRALGPDLAKLPGLAASLTAVASALQHGGSTDAMHATSEYLASGIGALTVRDAQVVEPEWGKVVLGCPGLEVRMNG